MDIQEATLRPRCAQRLFDSEHMSGGCEICLRRGI